MSKIVRGYQSFDREDKVEIPDMEYAPPVNQEMTPELQQFISVHNEPYEIIVNRAKADADVMSQNIIKGAIRQKDEMLQLANSEYEDIKKSAYEEGYSRGLTESMGDIHGTIEKTAKILLDMNGQLENFFAQYNDNVIELAIDIADKIMTQRLQKDSDTMLPMIRRAVAELGTSGGDATLIISDKLDDLEELLKTELPKYVSLKTEDREIGTCIVENRDAALDASVASQLRKLRELLGEH